MSILKRIFCTVIFTFAICLTGIGFAACHNNTNEKSLLYTVSVADYSHIGGIQSLEIKNSKGDIITNGYKTQDSETITVTLTVLDRWTGSVWVNGALQSSSATEGSNVTSYDYFVTSDTEIELKTVEDKKTAIRFEDQGGVALSKVKVIYNGEEFAAENFEAYSGDIIELYSTIVDSNAERTRVIWQREEYSVALRHNNSASFSASFDEENIIMLNLEYRVNFKNDTYSYIDCDFIADGETAPYDNVWVRDGAEVQVAVDPETEYQYIVRGADAGVSTGIYTKTVTEPTDLSVELDCYKVLIKNKDAAILGVTVHGEGFIWKEENSYTMNFTDGENLVTRDRTLWVVKDTKLTFEINGTFFGHEIDISGAAKIDETNISQENNSVLINSVWETDVITGDTEIVLSRTVKPKHKVTFETNKHIRVESFYEGYAYDILPSTADLEKEYYHGEMVSIIVSKRPHWLNGWSISAGDVSKYENETSDLFVFYVTEDVTAEIEEIEDEFHMFDLREEPISSGYQIHYKLPEQTEWKILSDSGIGGSPDLRNKKIYTGETVQFYITLNYGCTVSVDGAGEPVDGIYSVTMGHEDISVKVFPSSGCQVIIQGAQNEDYVVKVNGTALADIEDLVITTPFEDTDYRFKVFENDVITIEFTQPNNFTQIKVHYNLGYAWEEVTAVDGVYSIAATSDIWGISVEYTNV